MGSPVDHSARIPIQLKKSSDIYRVRDSSRLRPVSHITVSWYAAIPRCVAQEVYTKASSVPKKWAQLVPLAENQKTTLVGNLVMQQWPYIPNSFRELCSMYAGQEGE